LEDWQLTDRGQQDCSQHAVQAHAETENGARDKQPTPQANNLIQLRPDVRRSLMIPTS
jgi:hypothetical protein